MELFENFVGNLFVFCFDPIRASQLHEMGQRYLAVVDGVEKEYTHSYTWEGWLDAKDTAGFIGYGHHLRVEYDNPEHKLMDDQRFNEMLDEIFDSDEWAIGNLGLV